MLRNFRAAFGLEVIGQQLIRSRFVDRGERVRRAALRLRIRVRITVPVLVALELPQLGCNLTHRIEHIAMSQVLAVFAKWIDRPNRGDTLDAAFRDRIAEPTARFRAPE